MKTKLFIFLSVVMLLFSFHSKSFAETIYFKNGKVLREKIVERGPYYIVTKTGSATNKYLFGQIDHIEEDKPEDAIDIGDIDIMQFEEIGMSAQKAKLIAALIETSGVRHNMEQNLRQVIAKVPEEQRWEYEELFNVDEIIERLIPVYDKHYSEEELREIIQFYESPVGQKIFKVTPQIMKESIGVSVQYFQEKALPK